MVGCRCRDAQERCAGGEVCRCKGGAGGETQKYDKLVVCRRWYWGDGAETQQENKLELRGQSYDEVQTQGRRGLTSLTWVLKVVMWCRCQEPPSP